MSEVSKRIITAIVAVIAVLVPPIIWGPVGAIVTVGLIAGTAKFEYDVLISKAGWFKSKYWLVSDLKAHAFFCLWVLFPLVLLATVHRVYGIGAVLYILTTVWATDTFAYVVGKIGGVTPFFPRISPNKTLEGAIGGLLGGVMAGTISNLYLGSEKSSFHLIWISVIGSALVISGDLFESWLKRKANVKDSGSILPGHGGVLDRIDGLLFAAPFMSIAIIALWKM